MRDSGSESESDISELSELSAPSELSDRSELDRIAGTLLGMTAGDALGAGYEFATPPRGEVSMIGGGLGDVAPGEWTDDTSMAVCRSAVTTMPRPERGSGAEIRRSRVELLDPSGDDETGNTRSC